MIFRPPAKGFCCRRRGFRVGLVHRPYGDAVLDAQSSVPRSVVSGRSHHGGGSWVSDVSAQLSSGLRPAARSGGVGGCETVMRWVVRYAPELEKRGQGYEKPVALSWRVDETYLKVGGGWRYLYRAADQNGKSVGSFLSKRGDVEPRRRCSAARCRSTEIHSRLRWMPMQLGTGPCRSGRRAARFSIRDARSVLRYLSACACHVGSRGFKPGRARQGRHRAISDNVPRRSWHAWHQGQRVFCKLQGRLRPQVSESLSPPNN
jgi:hypothetical protein